MPQRTSTAPDHATPAERVLAGIAEGLRAARLRAGLDQKLFLGAPGVGRGGVDLSFAHRLAGGGVISGPLGTIAGVYETTIDALAGRRAYRSRNPTENLPPALRSAW